MAAFTDEQINIGMEFFDLSPERQQSYEDNAEQYIRLRKLMEPIVLNHFDICFYYFEMGSNINPFFEGWDKLKFYFLEQLLSTS